MAYNASPIPGVQYTGVQAPTPPNFIVDSTPVSQLNVNQFNIGDEYLYKPTGVLYKLFLNGTTRSWVNQGTSAGQLSTLTTSDSTVVVPSSGNINLTQSNGILTTGSGSTVTFAMSGSYTGVFTINAGSSATALNLVSTAAGASAGPILSLYRNKATSSNADVIGALTYSGTNSTPAQATYADEFVTIDSNTAAAESSSWRLRTVSSGTLTNQIVALNTGCQIRGNNTNTTPPAGYIGQIVIGQVLIGAPVSLTTDTFVNLTSVSLTAGIWDLGVLSQFQGATAASQRFIGIGPNSASITGIIIGYNCTDSGVLASLAEKQALVVPKYRVTISSTTTYYAVALSTFSAGTDTVWGTMTAVRVG